MWNLSNSPVNIEGCALLLGALSFEGQGDVRGAWNGLMRDRNLLRCPLQDRCDSCFGVSPFAKGDPRPDALSDNGIGDKNGEFSFVGRDFGQAFSAVCDIQDVQFENGAFVKEAGLASHVESNKWHKAVEWRKNTPRCHATLLAMMRSCLCRLSFLLVAAFIGGSVWGQHPDELAAVTFNIRYDNPADPLTWDQRKDKVVKAVTYFDILGFQEALSHQVSDLEEGLPEHDHYGVGRDDGEKAGEFCPVFWRRSRFDLLHAETLWLSPAPKEVGSIGWDAQLPRVATLVMLHDRQTDQVFRVVNAHFSHVGTQARMASAQLISSRLSGSRADVNLVLGDLNAEVGSPELDILTSGRLKDAYEASKRRCRDGIGTFTGFATGGLRGAPRIDHILVDGGEVLWYCTEEQIIDGFYISDHLPVYIALMP